MKLRDDDRDNGQLHALWGRLALLCFGMAVLAFLVAIERQNWFHIKPATGTAAAMAFAAEKPKGA